jgi:hypothetical protein
MQSVFAYQNPPPPPPILTDVFLLCRSAAEGKAVVNNHPPIAEQDYEKLLQLIASPAEDAFQRKTGTSSWV